ncbi:hypothetical protein SKAU_G00244660 [Synaphobranchus kaupii]|uniref:Uncharacterized protein n=1 Tax=Synaphobranchus kaupii TaxID=118154 RepID=A0A9Q1F1Q0_SYNKA|nr:hypothetical protein SKAU_G00244660 [Synaphobranchus kaupii]
MFAENLRGATTSPEPPQATDFLVLADTPPSPPTTGRTMVTPPQDQYQREWPALRQTYPPGSPAPRRNAERIVLPQEALHHQRNRTSSGIAGHHRDWEPVPLPQRPPSTTRDRYNSGSTPNPHPNPTPSPPRRTTVTPPQDQYQREWPALRQTYPPGSPAPTRNAEGTVLLQESLHHQRNRTNSGIAGHHRDREPRTTAPPPGNTSTEVGPSQHSPPIAEEGPS